MSPQSLSIKNLSEDDRPREKLLTKGVAALSNAELLAIILGSGSRDENAVELARRILLQAGNDLAKLGKLTVAELKKYKGVGKVKAVGVVAAMELGRRRTGEKDTTVEKKHILVSKDIFFVFHPLLCDLPHEEFWLLFLNTANRIIDKQRLSVGGLTETSVDVRVIMKMAVDRLASGIVLCHNHPSGNMTPGIHDIQLTRKIKECAQLLDIKLVDHLIIGDNDFYSFADEGRI